MKTFIISFFTLLAITSKASEWPRSCQQLGQKLSIVNEEVNSLSARQEDMAKDVRNMAMIKTLAITSLSSLGLSSLYYSVYLSWKGFQGLLLLKELYRIRSVVAGVAGIYEVFLGGHFLNQTRKKYDPKNQDYKDFSNTQVLKATYQSVLKERKEILEEIKKAQVDGSLFTAFSRVKASKERSERFLKTYLLEQVLLQLHYDSKCASWELAQTRWSSQKRSPQNKTLIFRQTPTNDKAFTQ